jgi:multidrug resistance efflux pump
MFKGLWLKLTGLFAILTGVLGAWLSIERNRRKRAEENAEKYKDVAKDFSRRAELVNEIAKHEREEREQIDKEVTRMDKQLEKTKDKTDEETLNTILDMYGTGLHNSRKTDNNNS